MASNEAFARAKIDALLRDVRWSLTDGKSVHYEYVLGNGLRADYVLANPPFGVDWKRQQKVSQKAMKLKERRSLPAGGHSTLRRDCH